MTDIARARDDPMTSLVERLRFLAKAIHDEFNPAELGSGPSVSILDCVEPMQQAAARITVLEEALGEVRPKLEALERLCRSCDQPFYADLVGEIQTALGAALQGESD